MERDAGSTCAKLCDPVTRHRGAGLGQSGDLCWWAVGPQSSTPALDVLKEGAGRGPARRGHIPGIPTSDWESLCPGVTVTPTSGQPAGGQRRVWQLSLSTNQVNNHYCGERMESLRWQIRFRTVPEISSLLPTLTVKCC